MTHYNDPADAKTGSQPNKLEETKSEAQSAARGLAEDTKGFARDTAEQARSAAVVKAQAAKSSVAGEVSDVAGALRKAADEARDGSPQARTFGQIAESLADVSDAISQKDLGEMTRDVSDFARRNPLVFLGSAALLGFAATRFAKASSAPQPHSRPDTTAHATPGVPHSPAASGMTQPTGRTPV